MKREQLTFWIIKWLLRALFPPLIIAIAIIITWYQLFPITQHSIIINDHCLSTNGQEALKNTISSLITTTNTTLPTSKTITKNIIVHLPSIESAHTMVSRPHHATITVQNKKPLYRANKTHCIVANGATTPADHYHDTMLNHLPLINFLSPHLPKTLSPLVMDTIQTITPLIMERNTITIENDNAIWLDDIHNTTFTILTNTHTKINTQLLTIVDKIKKELSMRTLAHKKNTKKWVADVRFKDQIIIYTK